MRCRHNPYFGSHLSSQKQTLPRFPAIRRQLATAPKPVLPARMVSYLRMLKVYHVGSVACIDMYGTRETVDDGTFGPIVLAGGVENKDS